MSNDPTPEKVILHDASGVREVSLAEAIEAALNVDMSKVTASRTLPGGHCDHPNLDDCGYTCHHLECPDCGVLIDTPDQHEHNCSESEWCWLDPYECDQCQVRVAVCVDCGADIDAPITGEEKDE